MLFVHDAKACTSIMRNLRGLARSTAGMHLRLADTVQYKIMQAAGDAYLLHRLSHCVALP